MKSKKALIYIPVKSAMQSARSKNKKWILEFITKDSGVNPLMGWESSEDTLEEIKLEFSSRDKATGYAVTNNINYTIIEPKKNNFVIKSYSDNFTKE